MEDFKIRASAAGKIMTSARSKSAALSKTTESYLQEWYKEQIYGVRNELESKYIRKGIECEDESIEVYATAKGIDFVVKNSKRFSNDYATGEPDLIIDGKVVDIKTSWNCFTFPLFDDKIPNSDYYWQLQVYMDLLGLERAELAYILVNTPAEMQYSDSDMADYTNLDLKYRVKTFEIDRNQEDIDRLYERVDECRKYLKKISDAI
jgi:hypothetical protein